MSTALIGIIIAIGFFAWAIFGMSVLKLNIVAITTISRPVGKWLNEAGNPVRLGTWIGAILIATITLVSHENTLVGSLRTEAISTAFAVIVINELGRYRSSLERKQAIIKQMGSTAPVAAVEAARLAGDAGWLTDGSLKHANLWGANLKGARLWQANLEGTLLAHANLAGANLWGANLKNADLWWANLEGTDLWQADLEGANLGDACLKSANLGGTNLKNVIYSSGTVWPDGYTPPSEAINEDELDKEKHVKMRKEWQQKYRSKAR